MGGNGGGGVAVGVRVRGGEGEEEEGEERRGRRKESERSAGVSGGLRRCRETVMETAGQRRRGPDEGGRAG